MKAKLLIILVLFAFGCKTTKNITTVETKETTEVKNDIVTTIDSAAVVNVIDSTKKVATYEENVMINETVVELSKPDSIGNQYPTKITRRETSMVNKNEKVTNRVRDSTTNAGVSKVNINKSDSKSEVNDMTKTNTKTKVQTPRVINWMIILLVLGALFFVYFILKRYGLIK